MEKEHSKAEAAKRIVWPPQTKHWRSHLVLLRQAAVKLCDLTIIDSEELIQTCHHGEFTAFPLAAFFLNECKDRIVCRFVHHIALHDFIPGLTQIAISPLVDVPVIRAEFAGLVRRRVNAGVCDERPLAVKAADISDLRDQARSQRVPDAGHFAHKRIFRQSLGESLHLC